MTYQEGCGEEIELEHQFGIEGNTKIVNCGDEDYLCEECEKKSSVSSPLTKEGGK